MKLFTTTIYWKCPEYVDADNAMNVAVGRLEEVDSRIVIEDHRNEEETAEYETQTNTLPC